MNIKGREGMFHKFLKWLAGEKVQVETLAVNRRGDISLIITGGKFFLE